MRKYVCLALALLAGAGCHRRVAVGGPSPAEGGGAARALPAITGADQLVAAMHDRYAGRWYRTLTFVQTSTFLRPDGTASRTETWYEAAAIPGRLRIDLGDPSRGNGVVYRGDSVYQVQGGQVVDRRRGRNPLLILGFDVYAQPAARTIEELRAEHIELTVLHTDTLYGRRMYVVGAGPRDTTANQFWVDADRMLFVRLIQTDTLRHVTRDTRFENYVQHGDAWVSEAVRFYTGGRLVFREDYANVRVNVPLDETVFVPEKWSSAPHWFKP